MFTPIDGVCFAFISFARERKHTPIPLARSGLTTLGMCIDSAALRSPELANPVYWRAVVAMRWAVCSYALTRFGDRDALPPRR